MREMRPLLLPRLVAARQSVVSADEERALASSPLPIHSRGSSTSTASEPSLPLARSPTFRFSPSARDRTRQAAVNRSSRPRASTYDTTAVSAPAGKLSGVVEEGAKRERRMDMADMFPCLCR